MSLTNGNFFIETTISVVFDYLYRFRILENRVLEVSNDDRFILELQLSC